MRNHVSIYCVLVYILCSFWKYNIFFFVQENIKHFIPSSSITCAVQEDRPNADIVSVILLIYNPATSCPVHVHSYRYSSHQQPQYTSTATATVHINSYRYSTHQQLQHCTHKQLELQYTSTATGTVHIKSYSYCTQKQLQLQYTSTASGQYTATCTVHINSYRSSTVKSCSTRTQLLL